MTTNLRFLGAAGYEIVGPRSRILIDPYLTGSPSAPISPEELSRPDVILVTHAAPDHVGDTALIARRTGAPVVCGMDTKMLLVEQGVPAEQVRATIWGIVVEVGGVVVRPIECHHWSSVRLANGQVVTGTPLAFIVETEPGVRIYHFGDTAIFDMRLIGELYQPTVGLIGCTHPKELVQPVLPGPGRMLTGEMSPHEAARVADFLGVRVAVATHYFNADDEEVRAFLEEISRNDSTGTRRAVAPRPGQIVETDGTTVRVFDGPDPAPRITARSSPARPRVGLIGLGVMGRPMALGLARAGYQLVVYSRSPGPAQEVIALGAVAAASPAALAAEVDVVVTMLPDSGAVETVALGANGITAGARRGSLVIDMGTTSLSVTRRVARAVTDAGGAFVDAPVSGGEQAAKGGTLTIMAGGQAADVERARSILSVLGTVVHVGPSGSGQIAKACNQLVVLTGIEAVAEALILAAATGVDPARVREALLGGFAQSRILDAHGKRMLEHDFRPGGRARLHLKDVETIAELGRTHGVPLGAFDAAAESLRQLLADGGGDLDHAALVTVLERISGVRLVDEERSGS